MSFKPGDKVRLVKHPTVIGTYIYGTRSAHIVKFDFTDPDLSGTYVRLDAIEPVPKPFTWDMVQTFDVVTLEMHQHGEPYSDTILVRDADIIRRMYGLQKIIGIKRPTYHEVEP
jgi:hypothetical protein